MCVDRALLSANGNEPECDIESESPGKIKFSSRRPMRDSYNPPRPGWVTNDFGRAFGFCISILESLI